MNSIHNHHYCQGGVLEVGGLGPQAPENETPPLWNYTWGHSGPSKTEEFIINLYGGSLQNLLWTVEFTQWGPWATNKKSMESLDFFPNLVPVRKIQTCACCLFGKSTNRTGAVHQHQLDAFYDGLVTFTSSLTWHTQQETVSCTLGPYETNPSQST